MARRRRLWPWLLGFAIVGVLLGAMAAAVARDRASHVGQPTARPAVILTPAARTPTPDLAAGATVSPTAAQSSEPAATPAPNTSLATFVRHVGRAIEQGEALLTPLQEAAQALDVKAVRAAAAALSGWAATESAWLDRHPPARCYAEVHREYGGAIDDFAEAAAITEQFAKDFPFADYDSLQRAQDLAGSGSASMQKAVDRLSGVHC